MGLRQKAAWIADELNEDKEDILDVLLGNIKNPSSFVASVHACEANYDDIIAREEARHGKFNS